MIASDLRNMARTLTTIANEQQRSATPLECLSLALALRSLAARVDQIESRPITPARRFPVIDGGGGGNAA